MVLVQWRNSRGGKIPPTRKQIPEANTTMGATWLIGGEKHGKLEKWKWAKLNHSNVFSFPVKVNVKTRKNYYSCGCAKLTFSPAPCFCLGKSILNLNFFNLGKSHCKQKGWNKSSVSPRLDFDCETLREILHNWNFYFSRLMLPLFSDIL